MMPDPGIPTQSSRHTYHVSPLPSLPLALRHPVAHARRGKEVLGVAPVLAQLAAEPPQVRAQRSQTMLSARGILPRPILPRMTETGATPRWTFMGDRRANATHQSATDPEARLFRKGKGKEARLVFRAHALMENRNGLLVDFVVSEATGTAERDAVPVLLAGARERGFHPRTLGGDKGYDTPGLRGGHAHPRGHPARGAKHERALQRYRWTHDPPSRVWVESACEEASRGDLRVDEDGGRIPKDALPRSGPHGPCRLPRGDSLQSGADGQADDC